MRSTIFTIELSNATETELKEGIWLLQSYLDRPNKSSDTGVGQAIAPTNTVLLRDIVKESIEGGDLDDAIKYLRSLTQCSEREAGEWVNYLCSVKTSCGEPYIQSITSGSWPTLNGYRFV